MRLVGSPTRLAATWVALQVLLLVFSVWPACHAQEPKPLTPVSVQISFLPPPLEHATYSVGIFDAKTNKLVRHLDEFAQEKDFTVGLNGLITAWDGQDDAGKPVLPGRYAARGYAVGPLKVAGEAIEGNDWTADDESFRPKRIAAIALLPEDTGLAALAVLADQGCALARYSADGKLLWRRFLLGFSAENHPLLRLVPDGIAVLPNPASPKSKGEKNGGVFRLADGVEVRDENVTLAKTLPALPPLREMGVTTLDTPPPEAQFAPVAPKVDPENLDFFVTLQSLVLRSPGKNGTVWTAADWDGLRQTAPPDETVLRWLPARPGEPLPVGVSASVKEDRLYLLEEKPGWQRVRGLSWLESKEEEGHPVSTWKTFFERNIRQPAPPVAGTKEEPVEINLDENPLTPGKEQKIGLIATFDAKGSYLATKDGLRLRQISDRSHLENAYLAEGKPPNPINFFQYDGAATDVFSITGARRIMAFDAGEFELTATGEKPAGKAVEPPDL